MQTLAVAKDALRLEVPGEPMTIEVSRGLAKAILLQGTRGLIPQRRPEVGGILLGTVKAGATTAIEIEGCLEVPCEHLFGPSYALSEGDKEALRAAAAEFENALQGAGVPVLRAGSMEEAVALAASAARPGDAVLLSPACASFDMFRNYKHRGEVFRDAVKRLIDATAQ